jgi:hypothetical protein
MNKSTKIFLALLTTAGLGITAVATAHEMGNGIGTGMGMSMGKGQHAMGGTSGMQHGAAGAGMSEQERTAMQEKMRNAKTPEERQQLMAANQAEMQKRMGTTGTPGTRGGMGMRGHDHGQAQTQGQHQHQHPEGRGPGAR